MEVLKEIINICNDVDCVDCPFYTYQPIFTKINLSPCYFKRLTPDDWSVNKVMQMIEAGKGRNEDE